MTVMTTTPASDIEDVARRAGLDRQQTLALRNIAASWAMEGMILTEQELQVGAEVVAGRLSFDEARRALGV